MKTLVPLSKLTVTAAREKQVASAYLSVRIRGLMQIESESAACAECGPMTLFLFRSLQGVGVEGGSQAARLTR